MIEGETEKMWTCVLRTVVMYGFLTAVMRLLGKRQLGELEISELVTTLMVSELAVSPITNSNISFFAGLVPIAALVTLEVAVSKLMIRSVTLKRIFGGTPSILIKNGAIDFDELKKSRIGVDELLSSLRQAGTTCVEDVAYAILEANGQLSVIPSANAAPLCAKDMKIEKAERGIAHGLIIDGFVNQRSLDQSGKSREWLDGELEKNGIDEKDVLLMTVDDSGEVRYQLREKK